MNLPDNHAYQNYHQAEIEMTKEEEIREEERVARKKNEAFEKEDKILINGALLRVAYYLELVVSIILIISICVTLIALLRSLGVLVQEAGDIDEFQSFLSNMFSVVIGIEFLKMLCGYNMDAVVEVILFTIARQLVLNHATSAEQLLSISAIAILFIIRKYLFVRKLDKKHGGEEENPLSKLLRKKDEER